MEVLLLVAEKNGPAMMARIGMLRALDRHSAKLASASRQKRAKAYRSFGDYSRPVNSGEKRHNPRIATLHCAIVTAPDSRGD
jgi:hypothetical protein